MVVVVETGAWTLRHRPADKRIFDTLSRAGLRRAPAFDMLSLEHINVSVNKHNNEGMAGQSNRPPPILPVPSSCSHTLIGLVVAVWVRDDVAERCAEVLSVRRNPPCSTTRHRRGCESAWAVPYFAQNRNS